MIQTPEEIMKQFANDHSYETWGELMYDCHEHSQIQYTKEVMEIYAQELLSWVISENIKRNISDFVKNDKNDKK